MPSGNRMQGTVEAFDLWYFKVACPEAPAHLRVLYLVPGQMKGAKVGDRVELEYQTTARSGLWNVVAVLA